MSATKPASGMRPGIQNPEEHKDFIELYNAIARKLLTFKSSRKEMAEILLESIPDGQRWNEFKVYQEDYISKKDLANEFINNPQWINPFSFFVFFNAYLPDQPYDRDAGDTRPGNWYAWLSNLKIKLSLDDSLNFSPKMPYYVHHPVANGAHYFDVLDGWMQNYKQLVDKAIVDRFWILAEYAVNFLPPEPDSSKSSEKDFIEAFNYVAPKMRTMPLLSAGLNWMNPGVWIRAGYKNYRQYYNVYL